MPGSISASGSRRTTARTGRPTRSGPLVKITGERPGDTTVTYDKGGWVFWMLLNQMGRDRALAGIQAFIKTYQGNPDHPVLQDFLAAMRPFAADPAAFDAFTHQWFFEVVVPEYRLHEPKKTAHGQAWEVTVRLENVGTGIMPVEVAATRGERFAKDGSPSPDYREARATVIAGQGRVARRRHPLPVRARADRRRPRRQGASASAEERGGQVLRRSAAGVRCIERA